MRTLTNCVIPQSIEGRWFLGRRHCHWVCFLIRVEANWLCLLARADQFVKLGRNHSRDAEKCRVVPSAARPTDPMGRSEGGPRCARRHPTFLDRPWSSGVDRGISVAIGFVFLRDHRMLRMIAMRGGPAPRSDATCFGKRNCEAIGFVFARTSSGASVRSMALEVVKNRLLASGFSLLCAVARSCVYLLDTGICDSPTLRRC